MAEEIVRGTQSGEVTMRVWRGDEDGGEFVEYVMPAQEGEVVLDVIHRVQATAAPDLACRWNCKAGKCGSCSAEINGMPKLMCMTRLDTLDATQPVIVEPMMRIGAPLEYAASTPNVPTAAPTSTDPEIVACMDDPAADYAIIPTWFLARRARQGERLLHPADIDG